MRRRLILFVLVFLVVAGGFYLLRKFAFSSREDSPFEWPKEVAVVDLSKEQEGSYPEQIRFRAAKGKEKRPLLVSLHSWGGTFDQPDSLVFVAIENNMAYAHPDFGGHGKNLQSCCTDSSVERIDQAIEYAIRNGNVDSTRILVVGKSGGATACLALFMKSKYKSLIKQYDCWSPIPDYFAWYNEVKDNAALRKKYFYAILSGTNSDSLHPNVDFIRTKSPMYFDSPDSAVFAHARLTIFVGVNDGITGSTSIEQQIRFYNKLCADRKINDSSLFVSETTISELKSKRSNSLSIGKIGAGKAVILSREFMGVSLLVHSGAHEMLWDYELNSIKNFCDAKR
jgi:hypothetical protein